MNENKIVLSGIKVKKGFEIKSLYTFFAEKFNKDYVFSGETHDFYSPTERQRRVLTDN